jgi:hypothetical protein
MATINVSAHGLVNAPAPAVYGYIADMRNHHPHFLPAAFSDFAVESGGVGAGTMTRFKVAAGGRTRECRMQVAEPEPGRVLTERDTSSSLVTTFTVTAEGAASRVQISTSWLRLTAMPSSSSSSIKGPPEAEPAWRSGAAPPARREHTFRSRSGFGT